MEAAGWTGGLLILGAYLLLSIGKLSARSPIYHGMNVAAATGFIINTWWHGAMPSVVVNIIWVLIGVFALWRIFLRSGKGVSKPVGDDRPL